MNRYILKIRTLAKRIKKIIAMVFDSNVSTKELISYVTIQCRYSLGQILAGTPLAHNFSFTTKHYKLYLTKSPVAMVFFGDPYHTRFEDDVARALLSAGDVCVDAGVNIGTFTLSAARAVGKEGHVYAFEAHPRTAEYARRNLSLNHITNVTLEQKALGDKEIRTIFTTSDAPKIKT